MKGTYKLQNDTRFFVGAGSVGLCKGSNIKVKEVDKDNQKVLIDFGYGFVDWRCKNTLNTFQKIAT